MDPQLGLLNRKTRSIESSFIGVDVNVLNRSGMVHYAADGLSRLPTEVLDRTEIKEDFQNLS